MDLYKSHENKIAGTSFIEVRHEADRTFKIVKNRTKRIPYLRSKYFKKDKIFLSIFWSHLFAKSEKDRTRRLRFYNCAIDLIRNTTLSPVSRENYQNKDEILHRFYGKSQEGELFVVQIKENKRTARKDFISVYPEK